MTHIVMGIQYTGTAYHGWQRQDKSVVPTVQSYLEKALNTVAPQACPIQVVCAGRTDKGVHAFGQIVHFKSTVGRDGRAWLLGTNANLPHDIGVNWIHHCDSTFHARYSALARRYCYIIYNHPVRSALWADKVTCYYRPLDINKMRQAAQHLIGKHDFSSFRAANCQAKSPNRCVHFIHITQNKPYIVVDIQANAFLHHMVRNIVGVLLEIGAKKLPADAMQTILQARDRRQACITAPASGLYLTDVLYPDAFALPQAVAEFPFGINGNTKSADYTQIE